MGNLSKPDQQLYARVAEILEAARGRVARTVNTAMVQTYWLIGREIVLVEQRGARRAEYGDELIRRLSARLGRRYGDGFSAAGLRRMRQFYSEFPRGSALRVSGKRSTLLSELSNRKQSTVLSESAGFPPTLSWSHHLVLMRVENPLARSFYEIEASHECWSVRELERQVGALLFERLAANRSGKRVRDLARRGQKVSSPADVLKDPFVLEFLDLEGKRWSSNAMSSWRSSTAFTTFCSRWVKASASSHGRSASRSRATSTSWTSSSTTGSCVASCWSTSSSASSRIRTSARCRCT
ncbi:MAG: hypothetical protein JNK82_03700 [Myxococcaceae bacterium]|nr:hypothetical protein [Myxococcaceae bacterium]